MVMTVVMVIKVMIVKMVMMVTMMMTMTMMMMIITAQHTAPIIVRNFAGILHRMPFGKLPHIALSLVLPLSVVRLVQ